MKTKIFNLLILLLGSASLTFAQEPKKMHVVIDRDVDGKVTIIDTTFTSRTDMEAWMKAEGLELPEMVSIPRIPEIPELPEMPDLEALPDMDKIEIDLEGMKLSDEDRATMRKEMEEAAQEMKKARKEMKLQRKEFDKARQEMHEMHLRVERDGFEHKMVYIHDGEKDGKPCDATSNVMLFTDDNEGQAGESKVYIVRMICDSSSESTVQKSRSVMKERTPESPAIEERNENRKGPAEPAASANATDHLLAASDFKLFPNPTQGKVRVTFNSGIAGPVYARILDTHGKVVAEEKVESPDGSFDREYTIENGARGTYLLQLKQGDKWRHEKIVLK